MVSLIKREEVSAEIKEYASAEEYLADGCAADILFLDIEMKEKHSGDVGEVPGMNGMELAVKIRAMELSCQPVIIFTTGHEKYVYTAFDVNAFAYLLKPVHKERFLEVFQRAIRQIGREKDGQRQVLLIPYNGGQKTIPFHSIYYVESQNHKVVLHRKEETYSYYAKIETLEKKLYSGFCRIHRSYLVNLEYVEEYSRTEVTLKNGEKLLISKYKYHDFVKAFMAFITE